MHYGIRWFKCKLKPPKNGENRDEDVKPETFEVNEDDNNEIIQNKSSDGQQGKWDHEKEGKQDVSTGKQEGKQTVSTYHEADAKSSDDENGAEICNQLKLVMMTIMKL